MKIIRALWGDFLVNYKEEIPKSPMFDEAVYVWGKENLEYLKSLGYNTLYVGDFGDSFILKLKALNLGYRKFGEILFLDWDCTTELTLSEIKKLKLPSPCMPLYSYPTGYSDLDLLHKHSWKLDDMLVLPNACFIYTKDVNIGKELEKISSEYNLDVLTEEFAMHIWSNCTLDTYIEKFDVPYLNGRTDSQEFILDSKRVNTAVKLNNYIGKKEILFTHN